MIEHSEKIDAISKSILEAQKEIRKAIKGSANPYFKSKYADLEAVIDAVKEPLNKHGIAFLQAVNQVGDDNGRVAIETVLLHEGGQYMTSKTPVYCTKPNDSQALGSGITYSKRYALQAMLGLPSEDDDGNAASKKGNNKKPAFTEQQTKLLAQAYDLYCEYNNPIVGEGVHVDKAKWWKIAKKLEPPKDAESIKEWNANNIDLKDVIITDEQSARSKSNS